MAECIVPSPTRDPRCEANLEVAHLLVSDEGIVIELRKGGVRIGVGDLQKQALALGPKDRRVPVTVTGDGTPLGEPFDQPVGLFHLMRTLGVFFSPVWCYSNYGIEQIATLAGGTGTLNRLDGLRDGSGEMIEKPWRRLRRLL